MEDIIVTSIIKEFQAHNYRNAYQTMQRHYFSPTKQGNFKTVTVYFVGEIGCLTLLVRIQIIYFGNS